MAMKPNGKPPVSSPSDEKVMFFQDVSLGPHETQLRFRLIHFWEAWNPIKKMLIGLEMFLFDEHVTTPKFITEGTVIQGFISPSRIEKYLGTMKRGKVYKLDNFYGSSNKSVYQVSDHAVTVSFSWNSELSELQNITTPFDEDRFRFHSYEVFEANCDLKGDLYDVVGHMKLVNGHTLTESPVLDEVQIAAASGPVIKLYLWDQVATEFYRKFKSCETTPTFEFLKWDFRNNTCTLAITSMSSSRVFMDYDVQPTIDYFGWLGSNPAIAEQVDAEVVTKRETMTIGELFSYIKQESAMEAFFECTVTIDDVVHGSAWYYISCSECHTKVTSGPTSLICTNNKCGKVNVDGVAQYIARLSVYDNSDQAVFVLLGDVGRALTRKHESKLVSSYFEANANEGSTRIDKDSETCGQRKNDSSLQTNSRTAPRFDDFILSTLPSMFPHLVAAFIASCVFVTLPFAMFATPSLDSVLLRVCSVDLEDCFWSQVWAHVSRGLASVLPHSCCSLLPLLPLV
ncbi:hypothetical protein F2Q69_00052118 [Brassica cretica]|uniref:Replication factor A C-terminal domain-containing protein n=1 Tax=Brassica cretica TaxID=69181 RepID=A0A8S9N7P3_BRACR|nr:hypothetical protein F2Q69_00052118 [Brassica cretica]